MLEIIVKDINNNEFNLSGVDSFSLSQEADVPADDVSFVLPSAMDLPEMNYITVKKDDEVVFYGLVDEQQVIKDDANIYTKFVGRSMAAVLLDNESKPINYTYPSDSVIFSKHLKPYGITKYKGDNKFFAGVINISKGTTCWQALNRFCLLTYGNSPRIEYDGTANFKGVKKNEVILFSNKNGVSYYSIKEKIKRCELISNVYVKGPESSSYNTEVTNEEAIEKGINRSRYIDGLANLSALNTAKSIIINSKNKSYEITLITKEPLLNILGYKAVVEDENLGTKNNLYVSAVYYHNNSNKEYTVVKLKKE